MSRTILLHTFCSIKGGVGKSTLAVATAKLLAQSGRVPLLVDADLTGTSLADGLLLRAPKVALRPDGALSLDAEPTGELYTMKETAALRTARKVAQWKERPPPPVYLNDALTYVGLDDGEDCRIDGMIWRHQREDRVQYLPSSPLSYDVSIGLGWIYNENPFRWIRRFAWILDALLHHDSTLTDVVIDLPPGIWGFAHETLVLVAALSSGKPLPAGFPAWGSEIKWNVNPFLVTTPDRNDILPALEYVAAESARLPELVALVNRSTESIAGVRADVRQLLGSTLSTLGIEERIRSVDDMRATLGRVFIEQDLRMDNEVQKLQSVLLKEVS